MEQEAVAEQGLDHVICGLCGGQFRAISNSHLVRKHGFDPENPIREYLERFGLESAACVETREQQKESYREHLDLHGKAWTAERVLRAIQAMRAAGEPLNSRHVSTARQQLILSARRFFGSWDRAIEAAGLDPASIRLTVRWTPEGIVDRIRDLARQAPDGRPPREGSLLQAARRAFGTWREALRAAGIGTPPPAEVEVRIPRPAWTPDRILDRIRELARNPEALRPREIARREGGLWRASRREFGSWGNAVRAAGLPYAFAERPASKIPLAPLPALAPVSAWSPNSPVVA